MLLDISPNIPHIKKCPLQDAAFDALQRVSLKILKIITVSLKNALK